MNKPHMMDEKHRKMWVRFDWLNISIYEEWNKLWHIIWDVTEEAVKSVLDYWIHLLWKSYKDHIELSHPTSKYILEVRKKKDPLFKRLFRLFNKDND